MSSSTEAAASAGGSFSGAGADAAAEALRRLDLDDGMRALIEEGKEAAQRTLARPPPPLPPLRRLSNGGIVPGPTSPPTDAPTPPEFALAPPLAWWTAAAASAGLPPPALPVLITQSAGHGSDATAMPSGIPERRAMGAMVRFVAAVPAPRDLSLEALQALLDGGPLPEVLQGRLAEASRLAQTAHELGVESKAVQGWPYELRLGGAWTRIGGSPLLPSQPKGWLRWTIAAWGCIGRSRASGMASAGLLRTSPEALAEHSDTELLALAALALEETVLAASRAVTEAGEDAADTPGAAAGLHDALRRWLPEDAGTPLPAAPEGTRVAAPAVAHSFQAALGRVASTALAEDMAAAVEAWRAAGVPPPPGSDPAAVAAGSAAHVVVVLLLDVGGWAATRGPAGRLLDVAPPLPPLAAGLLVLPWWLPHEAAADALIARVAAPALEGWGSTVQFLKVPLLRGDWLHGLWHSAVGTMTQGGVMPGSAGEALLATRQAEAEAAAHGAAASAQTLYADSMQAAVRAVAAQQRAEGLVPAGTAEVSASDTHGAASAGIGMAASSASAGMAAAPAGGCSDGAAGAGAAMSAAATAADVGAAAAAAGSVGL